jgi:rhodanese-related sulfurtransferase
MKYINISFLLLLFSTLFLAACNDNGTSDKKEIAVETPENVNETELLYSFIEKSGDVINSEGIPAIVSADNVFNNLSKYKVVDIRGKTDYSNGHIDGAIQVAAKDLFNFMEEEIVPANYEKIVLACYSGQTAAYYASLLRLAGYGNVYSLKYGMTGWSKKIIPNKWATGISSKYAALVETKNNPKGKKGDVPAIKTGEKSGFKIMMDRAKAVADEGFKPAIIKVDSVMQNVDNYYVINYWPKDKYMLGHLPGAIQYQPKEALNKDKSLVTIPTDKPVVVYCYTGQHSAFVTAYLRVLGYNARSLLFGANSFMHNKMLAEVGHAFNPAKDVKDYPLTIGEKPSLKITTTTTSNETDVKPVSTTPLPKKKKKKAVEDGGC